MSRGVALLGNMVASLKRQQDGTVPAFPPPPSAAVLQWHEARDGLLTMNGVAHCDWNMWNEFKVPRIVAGTLRGMCEELDWFDDVHRCTRTVANDRSAAIQLLESNPSSIDPSLALEASRLGRSLFYSARMCEHVMHEAPARADIALAARLGYVLAESYLAAHEYALVWGLDLEWLSDSDAERVAGALAWAMAAGNKWDPQGVYCTAQLCAKLVPDGPRRKGTPFHVKSLEYAAACGNKAALNTLSGMHSIESPLHWDFAERSLVHSSRLSCSCSRCCHPDIDFVNRIYNTVSTKGTNGAIDTVAMSRVVFAIGHMLHRCDAENQSNYPMGRNVNDVYPVNAWSDDLFGIASPRHVVVNAFVNVMSFHQRCCDETVLAIRTWTAIARRLRMVKDIRRLIGEWIWAQRSTWYEWDYFDPEGIRRKSRKIMRTAAAQMDFDDCAPPGGFIIE